MQIEQEKETNKNTTSEKGKEKKKTGMLAVSWSSATGNLQKTNKEKNRSTTRKRANDKLELVLLAVVPPFCDSTVLANN